MKTFGFAAQSAKTPAAPFAFERRHLRSNDVAMEVLYCGVCHTDLHQARLPPRGIWALDAIIHFA